MSDPVRIGQIIERWIKRRDDFARLGASVSGTAIADEILADLNNIAASDGKDELTLTAASELSGYTTDHLSRLIRDGKLTNHGRTGKPLIPRSELPMRRRGAIANGGNKSYSPVTDARLSVGVRR